MAKEAELEPGIWIEFSHEKPSVRDNWFQANFSVGLREKLTKTTRAGRIPKKKFITNPEIRAAIRKVQRKKGYGESFPLGHLRLQKTSSTVWNWRDIFPFRDGTQVPRKFVNLNEFMRTGIATILEYWTIRKIKQVHPNLKGFIEIDPREDRRNQLKSRRLPQKEWRYYSYERALELLRASMVQGVRKRKRPTAKKQKKKTAKKIKKLKRR